MVVVDSSVWIDFLRGRASDEVGRLRSLFGQRKILVGDLILCEVLQGVRSEREASAVRRNLGVFAFAPMVGHDVAVRAAANYRLLRSFGVTVRSTIDIVIGTFCVERGHQLLHADRDFAPMERHLGLRAV